jgi:hypothetical protein
VEKLGCSPNIADCRLKAIVDVRDAKPIHVSASAEAVMLDVVSIFVGASTMEDMVGLSVSVSDVDVFEFMLLLDISVLEDVEIISLRDANSEFLKSVLDVGCTNRTV